MVHRTTLFAKLLVLLCLNNAVVSFNLTYSFSRPDQWGSLTLEEADCCPYLSYPANHTSKKNRLPYFIGLGVQKSGSTTLSAYLNRNPDFALSHSKETHFMDRDYAWNSLKEYEQQWGKKMTKNKVRFEFTPSYFWVPFSACRIKRSLPNVKLVVILRNPADRAYSEYNMVRQRCKGSDKICVWRKADYLEVVNKGIQNLLQRNCTFTEGNGLKTWNDCFQCLGHKVNARTYCHYRPYYFKIGGRKNACFYFGGQVVSRGLYAAQLAWWYSLFLPENFIVILSHDFYDDPVQYLNRIRNFVGFGRPFKQNMLPKEGKGVKMKGKYRYPDIHKDEAKSLLNDFYSRPNLELYSLMDETNQGPYTPFDASHNTSDKNLDPLASAPDTSPFSPNSEPDRVASSASFSDSAEVHSPTSFADTFADGSMSDTFADGLADAPGPDGDHYHIASDTEERVAKVTDLLLNKTDSYPVSYSASLKAHLPGSSPSVFYSILSVVLAIVVLRQLLICHQNRRL